jgi:mono/diheme cytochrome c family protein
MRAPVSRNDVIITIVAAFLVGFSLVVSIVIPRRRPNFPGRSLRVFVIAVALLVAAMLTAVAVFGESHHFAAEGEPAATGETTTGATTTGGATTETGTSTGPSEQPSGDPTAGKEIFTTTAQPPCASCHTLQEANATGTVGPNLDEVLKGKDAAFIHESIVNPDAEIATGFSAGIMPSVYGDQLNDQQLADLVAFLVQATKG